MSIKVCNNVVTRIREVHVKTCQTKNKKKSPNELTVVTINGYKVVLWEYSE